MTVMGTARNTISALADRYVTEINRHLGGFDPIVLLYGSSVEGADTSDFDVCSVLHHYGPAEVDLIKRLTIDFHVQNGLKIDDEVPFEQKCVYSYHDIEMVLNIPPFPIRRGKFYIPDIQKSPQYLSSREMKFRLLLNILTTHARVLTGNERIIDGYRRRAWATLIGIIYSYTGNRPMSVQECVAAICRDPHDGRHGEEYLGYDDTDPDLLAHLHHCAAAAFDSLLAEGRMIQNGPDGYCCADSWLQTMIRVAHCAAVQQYDFQLHEYEKMKGHDFSENANPLGPTQLVQSALRACSEYINVYPDYRNIEANECLATFFSVPVENVAIANGSLEAIFALPRLLDASAPSVVVPTYWGYEAALKAMGAEPGRLYIDDTLEFNDAAIGRQASRSSLLFLCNPNNPTSSYITKARLQRIVQEHPTCHFIVDESHLMLHHNYSEETLSSHVEELGNVSLVYSLSKLFSVAGLRVGGLVSNARLIEAFKQWQVPYSLNTISQVLFPLIMNDADFVAQTRSEIHVLVQELFVSLQEFRWLKVRPSVTNFLLCEVTRGITAMELAERLRERGMFIRELKSCYPDLAGEWVRISVGTRELNKLLVREIRALGIS